MMNEEVVCAYFAVKGQNEAYNEHKFKIKCRNKWALVRDHVGYLERDGASVTR